MSIDDFLKAYGIDVTNLQGQLLDEAFRVAATRAGVKSYFKKEGELEEGYLETPYSTNVEAIRYYPEYDDLYVQFNNRRERTGSRVYVYSNLRAHGFDADGIFEQLVTSPSPGHVVWEALRRSGAPFRKL